MRVAGAAKAVKRGKLTGFAKVIAQVAGGATGTTERIDEVVSDPELGGDDDFVARMKRRAAD